jgi:hypothetical protein
MIDAIFLVQSGTHSKKVELHTYLDRAAEEQAVTESLTWIKNLRHASVDGQPLRRRFTYRDDSLWWFAELYLHKQQVITHLFRAIAALDALVAREQPTQLQFVRGSFLAQRLAPQIATAGNIAYVGPRTTGRRSPMRLAAMEARATALHAAAVASRLRQRAAPRRPAPPVVAAFVHRAFWRSDSGDGSAEAYIGPVLSALEQRLPTADLAYISVGPATNFRARRWWHPLRAGTESASTIPIETYAPLSALQGSRRVWHGRHRVRRALWASADIRERSVIRGCDCWPIVRDELAGIALLQWPWSARAMDEAAAALDAIRPRVAVTYAEAGGWGRALTLECRRRGIPMVGLQHGFIYRHWLNYLHEPDEMTRDDQQPVDCGFPHPAVTLVFDDYAGQHLLQAGHFPTAAVKVTGSPRLDSLVEQVRAVTPAETDRLFAAAGFDVKASHATTMVLVATKYREAQRVLPSLIDAAADLLGVHLVIKTHPAETPDVYERLADGRTHVTVVDAAAPLAPLLRASRAVVTVNSTVALDAAVLGIPSLVIGLPNNLSPFVDARVMLGAHEGATEPEIARALHRILYDESLRRDLARTRAAFLTRFNITADGGAAARAAEVILRLGQQEP